ncbi:MAG TPA: family 16 glycosylhydrolase [Streptosporangiaceae bacterium]|nr:family 16 glycosylhydrolase [Streptosporangiaceae bacterium]
MSGRPADELDGYGLDEPRGRHSAGDTNGYVDAGAAGPSPDGWHSGVGAWAAVDDDGWEVQPSPDGWHSGVGAWAAVMQDDLDNDWEEIDAAWDDEDRGSGAGRGDRNRRSPRRRRPRRTINRRRLVVAIATILVVMLSVGATAVIRHISVNSVPAGLRAKALARPETTAPAAGGRFELSTGSVSPAPSAKATSSPAGQQTAGGGAAPPSGAGVPGNVPGWRLTYSTDFPGISLPSGWGAYSGQPGSDPYGKWDPDNVAVRGGELHFYANNGATGGVSFGGNPQTYGMYQVRMKGDYEPGISISDILLLWPDSNVWPPEIDFFEDSGGDRGNYLATVHPGPNGVNDNQAHVNVNNNNATEWHTYGVQWTPSTITFTVDGQSVGSVSQSDTGSWPNIRMNLDIQSQNLGPAQPANGTETMTVAWVAEYAMS